MDLGSFLLPVLREKKHVKVVRSVTAKALAAEQEVLLNKEVEENTDRGKIILKSKKRNLL